jgi:hypothetical protein
MRLNSLINCLSSEKRKEGRQLIMNEYEGKWMIGSFWGCLKRGKMGEKRKGKGVKVHNYLRFGFWGIFMEKSFFKFWEF